MDISFVGLGVGMLLLAVPLFFFRLYRTGLVRPLVTGALRMVVQLSLLHLYLEYLFALDSPCVNVLWVMIMVVVAAWTAVGRTRLTMRMMFMPSILAFFVTAMLIGMYFLVFVLRLERPFTAQYFIPIMGILLGNMLSVNVIALSSYYGRLLREKQFYYYLLGNGATRFEATVSFMRDAIVKAFSPCLANMAVMGLVSLPGTMIGQILGGSDPGVAVKYQLMIIIITLVASTISVMITCRLADMNAFDKFDRIAIKSK
ncbi:MAG: ABC transporter permease [Bacteroidaceae bacterium]|nr:ABC transporter permease [Bacteroidaceae bacterium]